MPRAISLLPILFLTLFRWTPSLTAATVNLGYISFNIDDPTTGQVSFALNNLTGQTFGCTIDFEICDNVSIATASLLIDYNDALGAPQSLIRNLLSPVLPGTTTPANFVFDSAAVLITRAELTGAIAPASFLLNDLSVFTANPASFDTLIDISGSGIGLLQLESAADAGVPEPATFFLPAAALPILYIRRRFLKNR